MTTMKLVRLAVFVIAGIALGAVALSGVVSRGVWLCDDNARGTVWTVPFLSVLPSEVVEVVDGKRQGTSVAFDAHGGVAEVRHYDAGQRVDAKAPSTPSPGAPLPSFKLGDVTLSVHGGSASDVDALINALDGDGAKHSEGTLATCFAMLPKAQPYEHAQQALAAMITVHKSLSWQSAKAHVVNVHDEKARAHIQACLDERLARLRIAHTWNTTFTAELGRTMNIPIVGG